MKLTKKLLLCIGVITLCIPILNAQEKLTPAQWRSDLEYLKNVVHSRYANLFYNVTAAQFDSSVAAIDKKIGTMDDTQLKVAFMKLVAQFKVGHTAVRRRSGAANNPIPWVHMIPVTFYLFSDGLYIKEIDAKYKEALGGKVVKIGATNTETALQKIRPLISFENEQGFKSLLGNYLNIPEFLQSAGITDNSETVSITYAKDGREKTITIPAQELPNMNPHGGPDTVASLSDAYENLNQPNAVMWLKQTERLRYFEYIPQTKTVYVRHSAVQDEQNETVAAFFEKVFRFIDSNDVDRFILDIRMNGGGNNYLNKPLITGIIQAKKINRRGQLFVVIGKATFSAAQNLTNELEKYTEAIFVGEPTSENVNFYGDTRTEILPNSKLNVALSWMWWQNMDPRDKRKWTAPHIAVDLSFADYKNGIDPVIAAINNYKNQGPIDNALRGLVGQGKFDEAVSMAKEYIKDPSHKYFIEELEKKINDYGYSLIGQTRFEEANKVLQMNIQIFPESANAYDSYAESFWKLGKKEEALKYYSLAVAKDPNGVTGEGAKKMIAQIKGNYP